MRLQGLLIAALLALAACGRTEHVAGPPSSGFLGADTYARLQQGTAGETAARFYVNRGVDIRRYTRIIVEPVQFWRVPGGREQLSAEQRQVVTDLFYAALREELAKDFQLVSQPGPDTMIVATAVTEVREGGPAVLSTVSSFVPITRLARRGADLLTGSDPLSGGAAGEIKVTDSQSGELIGAAVDSRDAAMRPHVRTARWDDAQVVAAYWAKLARYRLCRGQGRANCERPQEF